MRLPTLQSTNAGESMDGKLGGGAPELRRNVTDVVKPQRLEIQTENSRQKTASDWSSRKIRTESTITPYTSTVRTWKKPYDFCGDVVTKSGENYNSPNIWCIMDHGTKPTISSFLWALNYHQMALNNIWVYIPMRRLQHLSCFKERVNVNDLINIHEL